MINIRELYKYYGDTRAVGPLSASIERGEIVGLLGLNGSGKTTTLRVLACDLLPTSGSVTVDGIDVVENPDAVRAQTGYLPDTPPLYVEMTVREFLQFAARLRGTSAQDAGRRADDVIELTELGRYRHRPISTLSHGYRQRVGIAQAIVHRPKLVILDEPISGLDPKQIVEMRRLVRSLKEEHTVLLSSHILSEISETCDRILVIRDGEIAAVGTEAELFTSYQGGLRVDVTVRVPNAADAAAAMAALQRTVSKVAGITEVTPLPPKESGAQVASVTASCESDVREQLCRALVSADLAVLEMARSEHELESVFLQLSGAAAVRAASTETTDRARPAAEEAT